MGKITQGINGPFSGKVGNVVGAKWKDIDYMRVAPKINKRKKRSAPRLANESRFAYVNRWLSPFKPFAAIGLMNYSGRMTAYNALYSLNHKLIPVAGLDDEVDYSSLVLSTGILPLPASMEMITENDGALKLTWDTDVPPKGSAADDLLILAFDPISKRSEWQLGGTNRNKGSFLFQTEGFAGCKVLVFIAFSSADRKRVSPSKYLGEINLSI